MTRRHRARRRPRAPSARHASIRAGFLSVALFLGAGAVRTAHGQDPPPAIHPGAWELGVTGSLSSVGGDARWTVGIDAAAFRSLAGGLVAPGVELASAHQRALDFLDAGVGIVWLRRWGRSSLYPYFGPGGGLRQEWLGSFRTTRYPLGFDVGVRAPVSENALIRLEYRVRRVLGDPVADFTEHRVQIGLALLLANRDREKQAKTE